MSHWSHGPYGYVDHSTVHANRNKGIQGRWFPPWSNQVLPHSGCRSLALPRPMVCPWSSWKPLALPGLPDPYPGSCQPGSSSVERIPCLQRSLPVLPFLNASLNSLITFLRCSTSSVGFPSSQTLSLSTQEIYNFHKRKGHQIIVKDRTRWFTWKF